MLYSLYMHVKGWDYLLILNDSSCKTEMIVDQIWPLHALKIWVLFIWLPFIRNRGVRTNRIKAMCWISPFTGEWGMMGVRGRGQVLILTICGVGQNSEKLLEQTNQVDLTSSGTPHRSGTRSQHESRIRFIKVSRISVEIFERLLLYVLSGQVFVGCWLSEFQEVSYFWNFQPWFDGKNS